MRRTLTTIVVLLIIGAMMNLVFAWIIILAQGSSASNRSFRDLRNWKVEDYLISGFATESPGATWLMCTYWHDRYDPSPNFGTPQAFAAGLEPWQAREFETWCGNLDSPKPQTSALNACAVGWPMRSFFMVSTHSGRGAKTYRGGLNLPYMQHGEPVALPFAPLWPGILVNTALGALLAFAAMLNVRAVRQWNRYRRGRCPRCAYDLRGNFAAGCTECGWRRSETQESPALQR